MNEQENINRLHQSQLQSNYLMMANLGLNSLTALIMIINLLRPKLKKPSVAVRLIRNAGSLAQVQAERATILQEAAYEEQRIKLENGLDLNLMKENQATKLDLTNLKQSGENFLKEKQNLPQDQVNQVSKVAEEKVNQATETVGVVSSKLKSVGSEVSGKLKSGVDKLTSIFSKNKKNKT